jgi:hypothetical protein
MVFDLHLQIKKFALMRGLDPDVEDIEDVIIDPTFSFGLSQ